MKLIDIVERRLRRVEKKLTKGKGTWPDRDYVPDDIWRSWIAVRDELTSILLEYERGCLRQLIEEE